MLHALCIGALRLGRYAASSSASAIVASGVSAAPLLRALLRLWLDLKCFVGRLIFRPRRAFGRELLYLRFVQLLAQCGHELL